MNVENVIIATERSEHKTIEKLISKMEYNGVFIKGNSQKEGWGEFRCPAGSVSVWVPN